jgi:MFS family permease
VSTVLAFGVGLVALLLYAFREWRARTPLLKPALLRLKTLRAAIAGMPGQVTSYAGTVFLGLLFFEQAKGFSAVEAGLAFAPLGVAAAIGSALANRLLSARRWALFAAGAGVLCVLGLSLLALAPVRGSYFVWYMPALVLIGFGIVGAVPLNVAAGRDVPSGDKGAAYGLFETSTHISSAIAIAVLATVAAVRTNTVRATAHSDALAAGYQLAFGVTAGVALVGAIVTIVLGLRSERATRGERLEAGAAEPHAAGGVTDL